MTKIWVIHSEIFSFVKYFLFLFSHLKFFLLEKRKSGVEGEKFLFFWQFFKNLYKYKVLSKNKAGGNHGTSVVHRCAAPPVTARKSGRNARWSPSGYSDGRQSGIRFPDQGGGPSSYTADLGDHCSGGEYASVPSGLQAKPVGTDGEDYCPTEIRSQ